MSPPVFRDFRNLAAFAYRAQLRVKVIRRPRYACRACEEAIVQAPAPERPIARPIRPSLGAARPRPAAARPLVEALHAWLTAQLELVTGRTKVHELERFCPGTGRPSSSRSQSMLERHTGQTTLAIILLSLNWDRLCAVRHKGPFDWPGTDADTLIRPSRAGGRCEGPAPGREWSMGSGHDHRARWQGAAHPPGGVGRT